MQCQCCPPDPFTAVFDGIVAVPLIYLSAAVFSRKQVIDKYVSGVWSRIRLWVAFAVMAAAAISSLLDKASRKGRLFYFRQYTGEFGRLRGATRGELLQR